MATLSSERLHSAARKEASWVVGACRQFVANRCPAMAASIALYSAFSLAPTLVMVIAVAGWFFGADAARDYLIALLDAWDAGARRPLPLAVKTAFAWLRRVPDTFGGSRATVHAEAWNDARAAFEGGFRFKGECEENPWLRRAFPDFETLVANDEFITLATTLLLPVQRAPLAASRAKRGAATAGENA